LEVLRRRNLTTGLYLFNFKNRGISFIQRKPGKQKSKLEDQKYN